MEKLNMASRYGMSNKLLQRMKSLKPNRVYPLYLSQLYWVRVEYIEGISYDVHFSDGSTLTVSAGKLIDGIRSGREYIYRTNPFDKHQMRRAVFAMNKLTKFLYEVMK